MYNNNLENLKKVSNGHGGKREGAGRAKGSMNKATKEQKIVEAEFKQRVLASMDKLINSQMNLAQGCQMLFKIHTETDSKGKTTRNKPELVTCQDEIEKYLAGDYETDTEDYYFITTEKPDNKALDSLIDRVFGKATNKMELSGKDGKEIGVIMYPTKKDE